MPDKNPYTVTYPVILSREPDDIFVQIPDLKNGYTQGIDDDDAIKMAKDAIQILLEHLEPNDYPKPSNKFDLKLGPYDRLAFVTITIQPLQGDF